MFFKVLMLFMACQFIYADFIRDDEKSIVKDKKTNLIWQDDAISPKVRWKKTENYCAQLRLDDKTDWRVPKLKELETLVGDRKESPAIKDIFTQVVADGYWSADEFDGYAGFAWMVHFHSGNNYKYAKSTSIHVRCVREGK